MSVYVNIFLFLSLMSFIGVKALRFFLVDNDSAILPDVNAGSPEKQLDAGISEASISTWNQAVPKSRAPNGHGILFTLLVVFIACYLTFEEHDRIAKLLGRQTDSNVNLNFNLAEFASNQDFSPAKVKQFKKIGGAYWFEIAFITPEGELLTGWVNEFAFNAKPAQDMTTIDKISEKLGLPKTEDQINYVKKLKKINSALDTALDREKKTP
ncbi:MAG: hypothetical protein ACOYXC_13420 [Candidatus Rifleibacteriota bacterium]